MKVLLIDVDSTIPNRALMKLSWFFKSFGVNVVLIRCLIPIYKMPKKPIFIDTSEYDAVFVSVIFEGTLNGIAFSDMGNVDIGGTGSSDITKTLPKEIDSCESDYSIYPEFDFSVDFLSRGCIRICDFCVVRKKEGYLRQVAQIRDVVRHKKVKFLDNNFLALPNHMDLLQELVDMKLRCQFNQGLDIRLVTEENAMLLSKMNYMGEYVFAFDDVTLKEKVEEKLTILKKHIKKDWKIKFFIFCKPEMDVVSDVYARILWCKKNKVLPYFMRHKSCWASENVRTYNDFSAWCNQPGLFKTHTYEEFCRKRRPQIGRTDILPKWYNEVLS